ncbi:glutamine ABC transporter substrate-binding protein [Enterococcus saigonensis]|uniref:Glutamine ABC transporter substrate-binding protein n=1 Tax=Enterococcus saigonensis TaxID=1805431 RepID=A0A679IE38_9ENTE|nr:ABC transporter permease subunit [Enterococcus saigonensis]BCA86600.1 glutamine ABC transporter substrate-binding protein [Enterococcus saigonensis]
MNKKISVTALLTIIFSFFTVAFTATPALADSKTPADTLRVGMEAGYAPFNWTQTTDANGAVPIQGESQAWAGGYDVQIAKKVAAGLGKKLVIVKTSWDGLPVALQSGKIDAVIAGMSPTAERKKEIDFTNPYYESHLVIVTRKDSKYAKAKDLADFKGAKLTAQLNTFHYTVINQIPGVQKEQAQKDFSAMRAALSSGVIDGYVSERPEGVTATSVDKNYAMVEFDKDKGFKTNPEDVQVAVGMRKGDPDVVKVNEILAGISEDERTKLMDTAIKEQPAANETSDDKEAESGFFHDIKTIWGQYGGLFLRGAGLTLLIAIVSTILGTSLGLLIGVVRSLPQAENKAVFIFQKFFNWLLSVYIEVFRGTPMMVQAMVIYYGLAQVFQIDLNRTLAAFIIVSINTGAYMSEIVRGGIFAVDPGQFEAAQAIGMTHGQTMTKVVLPQVIRNILPATGNEFVINIKDTAVLSVISVADLFFQGTSAAGTNYKFFPVFTIVGIMYLIMTYSVSRILRFIEKQMDGPQSYIKADEAELESEEQ